MDDDQARAPRLLLLAEASASTGLGHFVRSSALGEAATERGWQVRAHLRTEALPFALDQVREHGWALSTGGWQLPEVLGLLRTSDAIVVDSYWVDGAWLGQLHAAARSGGRALVVLDDLADREFAADLVVNQNLVGEPPRYPALPPEAEVLLGPRYALLRAPFRRWRARAEAGPGTRSQAEPDDGKPRVLVVLGGTDAAGLTEVLARAALAGLPRAAVRVVAPDPAVRARLAALDEPRLRVLGRDPRIDRHMLWADLVVSAAGSTLWELCCLRRAIAAVCVADNQAPAYAELARVGALVPLGVAAEGVDAAEVARVLAGLDDPARRAALAGAAGQITDGQGAERVLDAVGRALRRARAAPSATREG